MWLARITPPPKPCTASLSSRSSKVLCWITTSGDSVRMQKGDEQCRNVESMMTTPVAVAAMSSEAPAPPAPPSTCRPLNVTRLEDATRICAAVAEGTRPRPLTTIRCEPVMVMPATVAPASPASVRSAAALPRPVSVTGAYAAGAS